jgi:predicted O-methyltransferase YrrM
MSLTLIKQNLFCSGEECLKDNFFDLNLRNGVITHASYKGLSIEQNPNIIDVFNSLISEYKPSRILEIGTFHGGLTFILRDLLDINGLPNSELITYDVNTPNFMIEVLGDKNIVSKTKNLFSNSYETFNSPESKQELFDFINQDGRTIVLCDGGSKKNEFKLISTLLKSGDIIMAHDYSPNNEYFELEMKNKFWNWMEIQDSDINQSCIENNLNSLMFDEFIKVAWVCKIKEK